MLLFSYDLYMETKCQGLEAFRNSSILFSIVVVPIYISTNSVGEFPFLLTLSSLLIFLDLLMMAISDHCEVITVVLICISVTIGNVEHFFMCLLSILYVFFGEMSI